MKNMNSKMLAGVVGVIMLTASVSYSSADTTTSAENPSESTTIPKGPYKVKDQTVGDDFRAKRPVMKEKRGGLKGEVSNMSEEKKAEIKANRDAAKENRAEFRKTNKEDVKAAFKNLSEDEKTELKELHAEHKEEMDALKAEYKDAEKSEEMMKEMKEKYEALRAANYEETKAALGDNTEALELLEARKEVYKKNQELREDSMKARKEFREKRGAAVDNYRTAFAKRLGNNLDKISDTKLENVLEKIVTIEEKYEAKTNLSEERKTKILSQIQALKELIEDKLNGDVEELDLDEILEVE